MTSPPRRVPLRGAVNCRDLGGYRTGDGHRVRWRMLFRSDSLAELGPEDLEAIAALGLRSVFDLRHDEERRRLPNRLPRGEGPVVHNIGFFPHGAERLLREVKQGGISPQEADTLLREMYRRMPVEQASVYGRLIQALIEPEALPALIHCTSGKDRTGFAAMVVLRALGVPRETVLEDYLLSNAGRRDLSALLGPDADPDVVDVVKRAHPDYLAASFATIDARWGSDEAYIREGLGLAPALCAQLRDRLLAPPGAAPEFLGGEQP